MRKMSLRGRSTASSQCPRPAAGTAPHRVLLAPTGLSVGPVTSGRASRSPHPPSPTFRDHHVQPRYAGDRREAPGDDRAEHRQHGQRNYELARRMPVAVPCARSYGGVRQLGGGSRDARVCRGRTGRACSMKAGQGSSRAARGYRAARRRPARADACPTCGHAAGPIT